VRKQLTNVLENTMMMTKMTDQVGSSRVDTVLKMLLIAFISLLAFSSGVYFGKQMSDSDYQLKALEGDFNHKTAKVAKSKDPEAHESEHEDEVLADDEVTALSEKYVNSEKDAFNETSEKTAHGEKSEKKEDVRKIASTDADQGESRGRAAEHAPTHGKPDLSAAHTAANRIANNTTPTETSSKQPSQPENRAPNSLPKTVGASSEVEFTVQVASYPTAEAAKEHANDLVKKGFPAFPVEATVNGRTWFRVSVGSFKTMKEATSYRGQLLRQAELQSAIVQRIQR